MFNKDSTKFVAFFLNEVSDQKILEEIKLIDPAPYITKQYLVSGVKLNDKWYYSPIWYGYNYVYLANNRESRQKDFFNQLQDYGFFYENSVRHDPNFWNSELFRKINTSVRQY